MTLEYHFVNFYDSGFDNQNESSICDDNQDLLNVAFLDSPENSISCLFKGESGSNLANSAYSEKDDKNWISNAKRKLMPRYGDLYAEIENVKSSETYKLSDASKMDEGKTECLFTSSCMEEFPKSSKEFDWIKFEKSKQVWESNMTEQATNLSKGNEAKPECIFTSTCLDEFPKSSKEYDSRKFEKKSNRVWESETTEQATDLSKGNTEKSDCIFTSTCVDEFPKSPKEYDWSKFEKKSNGDNESEKMESKIPVPVYDDSRFYYVPHELSTILEVDSLLMDESVEPLMTSDKCSSLFMKDLKNNKCVEAEDSLRNFKKPKSPSHFSANVMKVIQNSHIEKLLQEPGILEESDLTLVSSDVDSTCKISEKSTGNAYGYSYYKIKRFSDVESPSLISFLQHELSCMKDCADE